MFELIAKMFFCLLLAAALGFLVAWLIRGLRQGGLIAERDAARIRVGELDAALAAKSQAVADAESRLTVERDAAAAALGRAEAAERSLAAARSEAARAVAAESDGRLRLAESTVALAALKGTQDGGAQRIAALESQLRAASGFEGSVIVLRGRIENLEAELAQARRAADDAGRQLAQCREGSRTHLERVTALTGERQDLAERLAQCESASAELVARLQAGRPPRQYLSPPAQVDDLEWIYGVGPKLAQMLNALGVYQFRQVALWTDEDIAFFDARLEQFHGRIRRENWVLSATEEHYKKHGQWLGSGEPSVRMPETGDRPADGSRTGG